MTYQLPTDLSYSSILARDLVLPNPNNDQMYLDIASTNDRELDHMLLAEVERAPGRTIVRDAGGCKGRIKDLMPQLFGYYANGCVYEANGVTNLFQGFRFSGGTDTAAVTNVPAYLARLFPCISGSTTPRTARMTLGNAEKGKGLTVDKYGTGLVTGQHSAAVVQEDVRNVLTWSGDLRSYMRFMKTAHRNDFKCAVTVCNGGDISIDEALLAMMSGIPVIIIERTERAADQLAQAYQNGTLKDLFIQSFDTEGRELSDEVDDREKVDDLDFSALIRIAQFDENTADLGASTFAKAQYDLGLLTPVS